MISFGPIQSRRLGKSLGINNIPTKKICSYSCIYCQIGITNEYRSTRETFYDPSVIYEKVKKHLSVLKEKDKPDYLTFVANGEPTLDINLGQSIKKLKAFNIPIAVITNASLLKSAAVREDLQLADWVSVKIDTADEKIWKQINRPFTTICFDDYKSGLIQFSQEYKGKLATETMLVKGVNDASETLQQTADLVCRVNPGTAYISIPTRPPAIASVTPPDENTLTEAYHIFLHNKLNVELLITFEGTNTGFTGKADEDILNICAVHPIREDTMHELLRKDNADFTVVENLLRYKLIQKVTYRSKTFYLRKY